MSMNGNGGSAPSYEAIRAVLDADRAERHPAPNRVVSAQDHAAEERERQREELMQLLRDLDAKLAKLAEPPPLLRSKLTAKEKSDYMTAHGVEKYMSLPWSDDPPKRDRFGRFV